MIYLIDRQKVIDAVHRAIIDFFDICSDDDESPITYKDKQILKLNKAITTQIRKLPSVEPEKPVVHCGECKYYPFGKNNKETRPWCKIFVFEEPRYCSYGAKMDGGGE